MDGPWTVHGPSNFSPVHGPSGDSIVRNKKPMKKVVKLMSEHVTMGIVCFLFNFHSFSYHKFLFSHFFSTYMQMAQPQNLK